ncbi:MAG TPA: hypothetical protein VIY47_01850 [Ignavibacteriaceae bacterium]
MSRTYRRKNYRPDWVTQDSAQLEDFRTGALFWVWRMEVTDPKERKKLINWWHYDEKRQHWYSASKEVRKAVQKKYRTECNMSLHKYIADDNYDISMLCKKKLPWLD